MKRLSTIGRKRRPEPEGRSRRFVKVKVGPGSYRIVRPTDDPLTDMVLDEEEVEDDREV